MFQQVENHTMKAMKAMPGKTGKMTCARAFARYNEESGRPEIKYYNAAFCDLYASRPVVTIVGAYIESKKELAQALFAAAFARPTTRLNVPVFKLELIDCVFFDRDTLSRLRELFPDLHAIERHGCRLPAVPISLLHGQDRGGRVGSRPP
jgi:hypothetical protein